VKERLTGAIILVILIVLLVPELLSGPKGPSAPVPAGPPPTSSEEPPLRSYTINLGDDSHSRTESDRSGPAMPQPSGPEQPVAQPGAAPSTSQTTTADAAKAQSETPTTPSSPAMNSQPAGSAVPNRPSEAPAPAARASAPAQKPTPPPSATASRTEAPKPARTAATEKPAKPHQATASGAASTSESGWGVQLGVFASRENAERLALDVRVKGFKASVSPVTSGSRKLYRVRVGPTADRAAAQELQGRLKAAGRPGGTVVPYS
jgi:cell division septation protein DedD